MSSDAIETFQAALMKCQILDGLSPEELQELGEHVRLEAFEKGEDILTEGHIYQGLWVILHGSCDVLKCSDQSGNVLATLEPGNVFGEMSFFEGSPHSATIRCCEDVTTLCLKKEDYDQVSRALPKIAEKIAINIVGILSARLRKMDEWTCKLVATEENRGHHEEWQEFRARLYSDIFD